MSDQPKQETILNEIGRKVDGASLERLQHEAQGDTSSDSFADIIQDLVDGKIESVDEAEKRLADYLERFIDWPWWVPGIVRRKAFDVLLNALRALLVQAATRFM